MRVLTSNLFALLFLSVFAGVFYVWSALEDRPERHKRGFGAFSPQLPVDLSAKTSRTLLTVPLARTPEEHHPDDASGNASVETSVPPVEDGVFWSGRLEALLPLGFPEEHARAWRGGARTARVVKLEPGCGRVSNRLATFADGSRACVRYGINADQVQGETLTYYLACLLGITNLPPLVLSPLYSEQWAAVRTRVEGLQWSERAVVSLTEWVSDLTGVVTPAPLRPESSGLHPELRNKTTAELLDLMQWSDLIIFDYLTANFDRLVSNLFSLQWDPRVMERDTNNLLKTPRGNLVFIDNEAGRTTARRVAELHRRRDARRRLMELYRDSEPLSAKLGFLSDEHAAVLQDRIDIVHTHILHCKDKYGQL
ncbi:four-jointed box protein 1 isoform X2 [Nerophis ophidion]|uniref:four-jointed box protein 1 isoform X2 n=1 Tax=Nerophis ophidion TaxID=159077 RepID=UPI002ADFFC14|nr:four-jointed box protein 1 isoform X2 [Nerophis ophidion]